MLELFDIDHSRVGAAILVNTPLVDNATPATSSGVYMLSIKAILFESEQEILRLTQVIDVGGC